MKDWLARIIRELRSNREMSRLHPRVGIELERPIPAWRLKVVAALVAVGCLVLSFPGALMWVVGGLVVLLILFGRQPVAPQVLVLVVGFSLVGAEPFEPRVFGLVFGLHLVVVLVALVGDLPWYGLVERSLLIELLPRFVAIQVICQALAVGGSIAVDREFGGAGIALIAGVALAAVAWIGLAVVARQTAQRT